MGMGREAAGASGLSGSSLSSEHRAPTAAGAEQLSFPCIPSPTRQAEAAETNGLENASHLSLCFRSLCGLSVCMLWPSSSKEQPPALLVLSISHNI